MGPAYKQDALSQRPVVLCRIRTQEAHADMLAYGQAAGGRALR